MSLIQTETVDAQVTRDAFVADLLGRMTLEEKVGEMTQLTLQAVSASAKSATDPHVMDVAKLEEAILEYHVGSMLNVFNVAKTVDEWHDVITQIQEVAERRRLPIPVLYGVDAVHGHNYLVEGTVFPHNLAMAATWNPALVREASEITAREVRATGVPWNFAPVLDLGRQPLWSRFHETFGEDVHLATVLGEAAIVGMQGDDISMPGRVAATGKHFVGYSAPVSGEDRTPAWIPERLLREIYLPTFQRAVERGVKTMMINSGELNGIPVHASHEVLTTLLRDELGFDGVAVSDWEDIIKLHTVHRVAASQKEAVALAVNAGVDMSMVPYDYSFSTYLVELVREGRVPERRIDEAVERILALKHELGLFENALPPSDGASHVATASDKAASLRAARESVVMLKNESDALPLQQNTRVVVAGTGATSKAALHGSWSYSWQGTDEALYPDDVPTLLAALQQIGAHVTHVPGATYESAGDVEALAEAAANADVVVVVLAEEPSVEKPGDIEELRFHESQYELVRAAADTGLPVVIVLSTNRPLNMREIEPLAGAVLLSNYGGPFAGQALSEVLFGLQNPGGRLPYTYPRYVNSLTTYDHKNSERFDKDFGEAAFNPQWEFGHGLSFTSFSYDEPLVDRETYSANDTLRVQVTVTNTGSRAGHEVMQVFVRDQYASVTPPAKRLRAFRKIYLEPGEVRNESFDIPIRSLSFVGTDNTMVVEPGAFDVEVGGRRVTFNVH